MSEEYQTYVAGFLFDEAVANVALIRKEKPEWQKGLLNGIGGKVEKQETPEDAMKREFREETGAEVAGWEFFCKLNFRGGEVHFFTARGDYSVQSREKEEVCWVPVEYVCHPKVKDVVHNLKWLVPMAMCGGRTKAEVME